MKQNIYFFQFNYNYGNSVYLPYAPGIIWSYCKTIKQITDKYDNKGFIFLRDNPDTIVDSLDRPSIAAFSTYVWNWELSVIIAEKIKQKYPGCLVIFGGPQVPQETEDHFRTYPFIDMFVHGEGEITFSEILLTKKDILGISMKGKPCVPRPKIKDINILPSPYLNHIFDDIMKLPYDFQPLWETNRGCPYFCTYCDWGSHDYSQMRLFDLDRLRQEIDWFSEHKIDYILGCDSNFGLFPRDVKIAEMLSAKKKLTGYPIRFRVSFAKDTTNRVLQIAEILNEAKLDKGISLSVQSMSKDVLKIIKRKNLDIGSLSSFFRLYQDKGISTFTEIILGLPGETYESYTDGINELLKSGFHDSLSIYNCTVLPNAQLNQPEYKQRYGIQTLRVPIFLNHSVPGSDHVTEYEDIIISTNTLSIDEWKRQYLFSWMIQLCHSLKLTQVLALYYFYERKLNYSVFYEELLLFAKLNPSTIIGKEYKYITDKLTEVLNGGSWGTVLPEFSDITWSTDEASFLRIMDNHDQFYKEILIFVKSLNVNITEGTLEYDELFSNLVKFQEKIIVKWDDDNYTLSFDYPVNEFYSSWLQGKHIDVKKDKTYLWIVGYHGDKKQYAKDILWFGRKGGKYVYPIEVLSC